MAITAKFQADFSSFQDAVSKAELSLKSFEGGAGKVSTSLNKVANSLSGTKLIQDATVMAEAVERIGGTSKLTASELQRVSEQASEAVAKLKAMGQDVPPGIARIAAEAKTAGGALSNMKAVAGTMAGALGIGLSIGAVVSFGKSVFDSASQIHDMALQLGISAEAAQGFKFAAEQSGSSIETVGTALTKMNKNLAEGDKGTVAALTAAGLKFADIRAMKPEDAFLTIADAIQEIPDPMEQVRVGTELMGKGFAELLPGIKEGFRAAAIAAVKMSNDTVNTLEAAQDKWEGYKNQVLIFSAQLVSGLITDFNRWKDRLTLSEVEQAAKKSATAIEAFAAQIREALKAADASALHKTAEELATLETAQKKAADAAQQHAETIKALADTYSGATSIAAARDALAAVNRNLRDGITIAKMTREQQDALNKTVEAGITAYQSAGKIAPAALRSIWAQTLDITSLSPKIEDIGRAFKGVGTEVEVLIPQLLVAGTYLNGLPTDIFKALGDSVKPVAPEIKKATDGIGELSRALAQLAQISGEAFGGIVQGLATMVSSLDTANKGMESFSAGKKAFKDGDSLAGIAGMASGIMGIASAAIMAGKAIKDMFFGTAGRDTVKDFAASFQGFDELHKKLIVLGDEGERLWKKLTQGTKKGDKAGAQAVIDEITAALAGAGASMAERAAAAGFQTRDALKATAADAVKLWEYMRDSGQFSAAQVQTAWEKAQAAIKSGLSDTEQAQQAAIDSITAKYSESLSKLDSEYKSLSESVGKEAEEAVMGVVETQERARMKQIEAEKKALEEKKAAEIANQEGVYAAQLEAGKAVDKELREIFSKPLRIPIEWGYPGEPTGSGASGGSGMPGFAGGTNGYQNFGSGTAVMLHGWEKVTPRGAASTGGDETTVVTNVHIDGEVLLRQIAKTKKRLGVA